MTSHILILDDDADVACAAQMLLRRRHGKVSVLHTPAGLPALLAHDVPDVVLLDLNFTPGRSDGAEGLAALDVLRAQPNPPVVLAMTAYADVPLAVQALKRGACDFITKPWDNARLAAAIDSALAARAPVAVAPGCASALMGDSPAMQAVRTMIASVAPTEANVLVLGENGVGKELVARAVHQASRRAAGPFLPVDMGALPESTFESELFGHRKGAFTDAKADRAGRFQAARGGTLFLDEIGNLPLPAQAKLLTALERREVTPIGADRAESVDVRIVAATNLDEARLFDPSVFRPDLLFRLNTIVIRVPPLRERRGDIALLLRHYLAHYEQQYGRPARAVDGQALALLEGYAWPGNVRALRHACERAVILGNGAVYGVDDFGLSQAGMPVVAQAAAPALPSLADTSAACTAPAMPGLPPIAVAPALAGAAPHAKPATGADTGALADTAASSPGGGGTIPALTPAAAQAPALPPPAAGSDLTLNALERDAIAAALAAANGNISHAARMLGVSRAALYRKLEKHGI